MATKIEENRTTDSCFFPALRFCITFDVDLNYILSKFTKNTAQTLPLKIKCGVEKLNR